MDFVKYIPVNTDVEMQCTQGVPMNVISIQQAQNPNATIRRANISNPPLHYVKLLPKINSINTTETWTESAPTSVHYTPQANFNISKSYTIQEHSNMSVMSSKRATVMGTPINVSANCVQSQNKATVSQIVQGSAQILTPVIEKHVVPRRRRMRHRDVETAERPIHLLKSGNTYHSLEKLDEEKIKIVTNALKRIGDPTTSKNKSICDGGSKTHIKYRVVYPKDFEITESSEIIIKEPEPAKQNFEQVNTDQIHTEQVMANDRSTRTEQVESNDLTHNSSDSQRERQEHKILDGGNSKEKRNCTKKRRKWKSVVTETEEQERAVKVTRSGRTVKLPKRDPTEILKPIKQRLHSYVDVLTCLRCHERFHGAAKLNRHFAIYPTHKPNNMHTNLFLCFLDVMKDTPAMEKSYKFIEQLEELIVKIKNMLPCMINNIDSNDGELCYINEDLGRMLDMEPGKYNISFDEAVRCFENRSEKCKHLMKCTTRNGKEKIKTSRVRVGKLNEEIDILETEDQDCARTHSVDKWPMIKNRTEKYLPVKPVSVNSPGPNVDVISISNQNQEILQNSTSNWQTTNVWVVPKEKDNKTIFKVPASIQMPVVNLDAQNVTTEPVRLNVISLQTPLIHKQVISENVETETKKTPPNKNMSHLDQYQSSHFNIRSSPIKSNNTSFNKIHIKNSLPMFLQLTKEDSSIGKLNSENNMNVSSKVTSNTDLNNIFPEDKIEAQKSNMEFYSSSNHAEICSNASNKEFGSASNTNASNVIDMSQHQNNHLISSQCAGLSQSNYLLSSETSHRSPSDRLLSSENTHVTCNDHLVSDIRQSCSRLSGINSSKNENDFVAISNTHMSQNDCLLSSRSNCVPNNDQLLSSGNIQFPQSDLLSSDNMQPPQNDNLCVNETNLEGTRMSLPLLDHLGSDCLSFTDTELRGSSLDLPLDLFPFNHAE